jgi:DNA adenine methylase
LFCDKLDALGHHWILSNSDVKAGTDYNFFDDLYAEFTIKRVDAKRSINANPKKKKFFERIVNNQSTPHKI